MQMCADLLTIFEHKAHGRIGIHWVPLLSLPGTHSFLAGCPNGGVHGKFHHGILWRLGKQCRHPEQLLMVCHVSMEK